MTPTNIPHLCGGILFGLLLEARRTRRKARNKLKGGTDGLTAADVYSGLVTVVTGENTNYAGTAFNKCVSNYKNCTSSKGVYVPFTDQPTQSAFDSQYKRKDPDLLERMSGFIGKYLNETKCEWLVRALIETMQKEQLDMEIAISYTDTLKASVLHTADTILFLPFLLSVLHYVVVECPDCESGRPTFENWYSQSSPRAEWKFISDIGNGIKPMNVSLDLANPFQNSVIPEKTVSEAGIVTEAVTNNHTIDTRSDHEVIAESMEKALQPLVDALEVQKAQMPTTEQLAKPLLMVADVIKAQEHETAERIRENEKKAQAAEDDSSSTTTEDNNTETRDNDEPKGTVVHQTVVNQYGDHPVHIDHVDNLKL